MAKRSRKKKRSNPAASLTDDLIVEILARLPVKSLHRFKCVSEHWHDLICHSDHRKRLPQTLAGVFYTSIDYRRFPREARHFLNVSWAKHPPLFCPSLSFFPGYERIDRVMDSCNGLLLCLLRSESSSSSQNAPLRYLVCNPATESWVVLPDSGCGSESRVTRLGFDPAISLHFHVFEFVKHSGQTIRLVKGVQIYSSKAGAWSYKESQWNNSTYLYDKYELSIFFNGFLHLVKGYPCGIVAVDVEGETWWMLSVPNPGTGWEPGFLGQYQGQLCYINGCRYQEGLSIWVLKTYTNYKDEWILKHHVSTQKLCEKIMSQHRNEFYHVITVHPHCNMILYVAGLESTLMAYHIDREETWVIGNTDPNGFMPYIPYTPFYSGSLTNGHL